MTSATKLVWLFVGLAALLCLATVVGRVLAGRAKTEPNRATVSNLNDRILAWWGMVAVFAIAFWLGRGATLLIFLLASFYALREFISLTETWPADHTALSIAFYLLLPLQYWLVWIDWYGLFSILIPVYGFLILPSMTALAGEPRDYIVRVARTQWALMLSVYCISHAPALLNLAIPGDDGQRFLLLFFLLAVVQLSDVFQYVFGKLWGRRKLAPVISPSKTVEGLVGGGACAVLAGTALWWITPFTPLQAGALSAAIVSMGFLGGLSLSAIKRSLGAKDWGAAIRGHGGVLDRMDSISFAAPVFFHLTRYFFAS